MVSVRGIACCGRFAARGRNPTMDRSKVATQHRGPLNDSGQAAQPPLLSIVEPADNGSVDCGFPRYPLHSPPISKTAMRHLTQHGPWPRLFASESQRQPVTGLERAQPRLFPADIVASGRDDALLLRHLDLENDHVALAKRNFRTGQIELPHSYETLIVQAEHFVSVREKTLSPGLECLGVVKLQNLDIRDDQTGTLNHGKYFRQGWNVAAREYVFRNP